MVKTPTVANGSMKSTKQPSPALADIGTVAFTGAPSRIGVSSAAAPLGPRTVIECYLLVAEQVQRVDQRTGAHARAAGRDDRPVEIDARRGDPLPESVCR